jgi:c-di-GMP-binding flagellar brake protein YcgR
MSVSQDLVSAQSGFVDRRREQRVPLDLIPAQVQSDEDSTAIRARIVDISTSGLRLNLDSPSKVGSVVTVRFNNTVASGETRYCLPRQDGSFDIGLRLLDVFHYG